MLNLMKKFEKLGLLAFVVYLPIFTFIISLLAPKQYPGYSWTTHWISNLGERASASYPIFVVSLNLFAFLALFALNQLRKLFFGDFVGQVAIFFMAFSLVNLSLITFFPVDTRICHHTAVSLLLFFSLVVFNLLVAWLILRRPDLPKSLIIFNLGVVFFAVIFVFSTIKLAQSYPFLSLRDMVEVIKVENSFLI